MGAASNNGFNSKRFASLMARFDTGNPCEAEAMNAARAMRHMVTAAGVRFVDVMELPDVKQALDDQLQPVRQESGELREARKEAATLREELTERTRDVRKLAEMITQEREATAELQRELSAVQSTGNQRVSAPARASSRLPVNGGLVAVMVVIVVMLLLASVLRSEGLKGRNTNGLAKHKREHTTLVRKSGDIHTFSNHGRIHRRVRIGGASGNSQSVR